MGNTLTLYHNTLHQYPSATLCGPTAIGIHRDRDGIGMHREGQRCSVLCGPTGIGMHCTGRDRDAGRDREGGNTLDPPHYIVHPLHTQVQPWVLMQCGPTGIGNWDAQGGRDRDAGRDREGGPGHPLPSCLRPSFF